MLKKYDLKQKPDSKANQQKKAKNIKVIGKYASTML